MTSPNVSTANQRNGNPLMSKYCQRNSLEMVRGAVQLSTAAPEETGVLGQSGQ
jgi:hypothetical protein